MTATRKIKDAQKDQKNRAYKRKKKLKKQRMMKKILIAAAAVFFVFLVCYLVMRSYVSKVDTTIICENIFVGKTALAGMTKEEATETLEAHFAADLEKSVEMLAEGKKAKATLNELGIDVKSINGMVSEAMDYGKVGGTWKRYRQLKSLQKEPYVIEEAFEVDKEAATEVVKGKMSELEDGAVNAGITKTASGLVITEAKEGKKVNIDRSLKQIVAYLNADWDHKDFTIEMVLEVGKPDITAEDLAEVKDILGEFSTDAGGGDRWQNLKTGAEMLSGIILMPGEEISVYNRTAPYDEEHGYVQAGTYENGEIVADWGGGICQVSTTLYNAVIFAELEIVERYPHSMTVSYVDPSRDAAIAGGIMDFRFKNSYESPIYIYGEIDSENQLRFIIYGKETRPSNRTLAFESETVNIEEYEVVYRENPSLSLGKMEYSGNPHAGKDTQLWKIIYEDGAEVSREVFNTSYYLRVDQVIEVGTAGAKGSALSTLQGAIASQDYDRILEAIDAAQAANSAETTNEENEEE